MKIIVIEDELLACRDLERTLKNVDSGIEIIKFLHSVSEAQNFFLENTDVYDLIFSDIELGDGNSFMIFSDFPPNVPVIFCTAYSNYALEAFRNFGIDYVLKPFSEESILSALEKYRRLRNSSGPAETHRLNELLREMQKLTTERYTSIIIHRGDKMIPYEMNDIALFFKEGTQLYAATFSNEQLLVQNNLEKAEVIGGASFFRANRQMLVNRSAIKDMNHYFNRKLLVNLTIKFNRQIIVPKEKVTAFIDWLTRN